MAENTEQRKRSRIIIDRKFQLQYLYIWLFVSVGLVVVSVGFYLLVKATVGGFQSLDPVIMRLLAGVSTFVILFSLLMGILSVAMTHRVAGASYRLEKSIRAILSGDMTASFSLREGDYLQNLSGCLDDLRKSVLKNHDLLNNTLSKLEEIQTSLGDKLGEEEKQQLAAICSDLRGSLPSGQSSSSDG